VDEGKDTNSRTSGKEETKNHQNGKSIKGRLGRRVSFMSEDHYVYDDRSKRGRSTPGRGESLKGKNSFTKLFLEGFFVKKMLGAGQGRKPIVETRKMCQELVYAGEKV